jgi:purine-binding chemotaxis protein CheW
VLGYDVADTQKILFSNKRGRQSFYMNSSIRTPGVMMPSWQQDTAGPAGQGPVQDGMQVLAFACSGQRFAVPLSCVRRAVLSARPGPLPGASDIVLGVLNVGGETVTVLDFARRAGCGPTVIGAAQQFLIVELGGFPCALVVDSILGPGTAAPGAAGWPDAAGAAGFVDGAMQLPDGLCLVIDPARFLFESERALLAQALEGAPDERQ